MIVQTTHNPVLILESAKKTCHLPRNICDNITTVTKKCLSSRYDSKQILGRSLFLDIYTLRIAMFLSS